MEETPVKPILNDIKIIDEDDDDAYEENVRAKCSCDAMRTKIKKFLATKVMTQTHWLETIHVNSNSYNRFMHLKGKWNGTQNQTFWAAQKFFTKQEAKVKSAKKTMSKEEKAKVKETKEKKQEELKVLLAKVAKVDLPDDLAIYDDCDEVRSKLLIFLAESGMNQSALLSLLNINSNSWGKFMKYKGPAAGAENGSYVRGYRFLEKVRIATGKPKSAKRIKNEAGPGYQLEHHTPNEKKWVITEASFVKSFA